METEPAWIESARVRLRSLAATDEGLFCDLFTDPQTMQFIGPALSRPRALRSFQKSLESMRAAQPERLLWAVFDRASGAAIGIGSIQGFDASRRCAEAGIMLGTGARSQGVAKEAFATLVANAFETLALDEVKARIAAEHVVAERVLVGVGFRRDDDRHGAGHTRNRRPTQTWSVARSAWTAGKN